MSLLGDLSKYAGVVDAVLDLADEVIDVCSLDDEAEEKAYEVLGMVRGLATLLVGVGGD